MAKAKGSPSSKARKSAQAKQVERAAKRAEDALDNALEAAQDAQESGMAEQLAEAEEALVVERESAAPRKRIKRTVGAVAGTSIEDDNTAAAAASRIEADIEEADATVSYRSARTAAGAAAGAAAAAGSSAAQAGADALGAAADRVTDGLDVAGDALSDWAAEAASAGKVSWSNERTQRNATTVAYEDDLDQAGAATIGTGRSSSSTSAASRTRYATQANTPPGKTIEMPERGKESSRAAVYGGTATTKKKSHAPGIIAGVLVAALAGGGIFYAVNGNPFDQTRATGTASSAASSAASSTEASSAGANAADPASSTAASSAAAASSSTEAASSASTQESSASEPAADFENDAYSITLPSPWKSKVSFAESEAGLVASDPASGQMIAQLYTGARIEDGNVAGQTYSLGELTTHGESVPVYLFVPTVDEAGAPSYAGKSALEHFLGATPSAFASYVQLNGSNGLVPATIDTANVLDTSGGSEAAQEAQAQAEEQARQQAEAEAAARAEAEAAARAEAEAAARAEAEARARAEAEEYARQQEAQRQAEEQARQQQQQEQQQQQAAVGTNGQGSFWGVWIGAFGSYENAQKRVAEANAAGLPAQIFMSTDWSNLQQTGYYVVSAGTYGDEATAREVLERAKSAGFGDAWVRNTGNYQG